MAPPLLFVADSSPGVPSSVPAVRTTGVVGDAPPLGSYNALTAPRAALVAGTASGAGLGVASAVLISSCGSLVANSP